ncbi:MAG: Smr/MutS family protein [Deltaproteobacteria bacterium]|nr:Smr/MutS family protein [Deltaproteobacteria bacterium]
MFTCWGHMGKNEKKISRDKSGIPLLTDDDFPFAENYGQKEQRSFAELFNLTLFDSESQAIAAEERGKSSGRTLYLAPQEQIDLHGLTAAEAERKAVNFLITARNKGLMTVRIITGKGIHSQGGPVLRNLMEHLAGILKAEGRITKYAWENGQRERSGALIIYL